MTVVGCDLGLYLPFDKGDARSLAVLWSGVDGANSFIVARGKATGQEL